MKMVRGLVSVIVAAYNEEQRLPRCLDSLLGQTYSEMEIIIINDASTDGTQRVIDEYSARDSRIVPLLMPKNSGAPAARNEGMKLSRGEYLTMVDADDKVDADTMELCVKELQSDPELDLVTFDMMIVDAKTGSISSYNTNPLVPEVMNGEEACYWSINFDFAPNGMSRSPLEQNFPAEAEYGQHSDETVTHLMLHAARKVKRGKGRYYYYMYDSSVTHSISIKRFDILESRTLLRKRLRERGVDERMIRRLDQKRWRELLHCCYLFWRYRRQFNDSEQQDIIRRMTETYDSIKFSDLPLSMTLKPRTMLLPTFRMFYWQVALMFKLRLIHIGK